MHIHTNTFIYIPIHTYTHYQCSHSLTAMITAGKGSVTRWSGDTLELCSAIASSAKPSRTYGRHSISFCTSPASTMGDCFWPFLLGVVMVSKTEIMD